jgi:hypothetical protein
MSIEDSGDPRTIVAAHYEQTYEQVDQQIASAKQLLEERRMRTQVSPERPYPRRPKNRVCQIRITSVMNLAEPESICQMHMRR